ncbi:MAG: hypothetical protein OER80_08495 [Gammaproteobacteria bacterium]|nr:hypothetical protein [Gammaproteobacteria bacterium]
MLKSRRLTISIAFFPLLTLLAFASHAGNGLPKGPMKGSVNLQIIAFENCPAGEFTDSNRHMIAVKANFAPDVKTGTPKGDFLKTNTIALAQGDAVQVIDGNACNRGGAELTLPLSIDNLDCSATPDDPSCPEPDFTEYRVYVRLVGRPGSTLDITACGAEVEDTAFDENDTLEVLCSTESTVDLARTSGKNGRPKFKDYSAELLTVCLAVDDSSTCTQRVALFDPLLEDYMWKLETGGRPHAQLRLIPVLSP